MHAVFGLEPAISIAALDLDRGRFDAGFFALRFFDEVDLEAAVLGPARLHTQQHSGPVLALGAAGAGMDFKIGIVVVSLAGKQRLKLAARNFPFELAQARFRFGDDALILLRLAELDQRNLIVEFLRNAGERGEIVVKRGTLLHHAASALRIVPQIWIFRLPVQLGKPRACLVDVKDASSAARSTA